MLLHKSIATACILSLSLGLAAPAQALGKNERNVLKGIAAALIVGAIVKEGRKSQPAPAPQPVYRAPAYITPSYSAPQVHAPRVKTGRVIGQQSTYGSGVNNTTAARVFNSYTIAERVEIQRQLANIGYYRGSLDGAFGPRTHQAVYEFARYAGKQDALNSTSGAFQVYNALLG
jgi:hypothetical protein